MTSSFTMSGRVSISSAYCSACDRHYHNVTLLKKHNKKHHNGAEFKTTLSNQEFIEKFRHMDIVQQRICPHCDRTFSSKSSRQAHFRRFSGPSSVVESIVGPMIVEEMPDVKQIIEERPPVPVAQPPPPPPAPVEQQGYGLGRDYVSCVSYWYFK